MHRSHERLPASTRRPSRSFPDHPDDTRTAAQPLVLRSDDTQPARTSIGVRVAAIRNMGAVRGKALVQCGERDLGAIEYEVEIGRGGQASVVRFGRAPNARNGERLHLIFEDGRMLDCQVVDASPFCAVLGEGPYFDRRRRKR
jgi:hypothetical protein